MGVVGSPLFKSSGLSGDLVSCMPVQDGNVANDYNSAQESEMDPDFLRSWVDVVVASTLPPSTEGPSPAPLPISSTSTRCDKLAHGVIQRNTTGAGSATEEQPSYRSILARMVLGSTFGSRIAQSTSTPANNMLQPSNSKSTVSTQPISLSSHPQARLLLSGQVAGDFSTIKIRGLASKTTSTLPLIAAAPLENNNNNLQDTSQRSRQNTSRLNMRTAATNNRKKNKINNLKSLGVFDFPKNTKNRDPLKKKRQAMNRFNNHKGYSRPTVKSLGIFNFDLRSEISNSIMSHHYSLGRINNTPAGDIIINNNTGAKNKTRCNVVVKTVQSNFTVELDYWQDTVAKLASLYGSTHSRTREAQMALGNTYLKWGEYILARKLFQSLLDDLHYSERLKAACLMEKIGCALAFQQQAQQHQSLDLVQEALLIRYQSLGPLHVDTIETMNVLASVYYRRDACADARECFEEVCVLRKALFGPNHPSVAVGAQELGQVHAKLGEDEKAREYYQQALQIYSVLKIPNSNPSVVSVQKDLQALDDR